MVIAATRIHRSLQNYTSLPPASNRYNILHSILLHAHSRLCPLSAPDTNGLQNTQSSCLVSRNKDTSVIHRLEVTVQRDALWGVSVADKPRQWRAAQNWCRCVGLRGKNRSTYYCCMKNSQLIGPSSSLSCAVIGIDIISTRWTGRRRSGFIAAVWGFVVIAVDGKAYVPWCCIPFYFSKKCSILNMKSRVKGTVWYLSTSSLYERVEKFINISVGDDD